MVPPHNGDVFDFKNDDEVAPTAIKIPPITDKVFVGRDEIPARLVDGIPTRLVARHTVCPNGPIAMNSFRHWHWTRTMILRLETNNNSSHRDLLPSWFDHPNCRSDEESKFQLIRRHGKPKQVGL